MKAVVRLRSFSSASCLRYWDSKMVHITVDIGLVRDIGYNKENLNDAIIQVYFYVGDIWC